ncbi:hypothetical protein SS50377_24730 [Spironucleus salmonicida]|uniref:Uncharacterized protein n=1 Tax=Spironucleus salmonicida TaxID=348837 RepID=V6LLH4_9EUKA|nr:hypothetical protein SS50377_24730 [Spironucleus salmonicida]|eukprot:EST44611.1 Hypothetical protein SS50377_15616 [Spironucleus salmonicida]
MQPLLKSLNIDKLPTEEIINQLIQYIDNIQVEKQDISSKYENCKSALQQILQSNLAAHKKFYEIRSDLTQQMLQEKTFRNEFLTEIEDAISELRQEAAIMELDDLTYDCDDEIDTNNRNELEEAVFQLQKAILKNEKQVSELECPEIINTCRRYAESEFLRNKDRIKDLQVKIDEYCQKFQLLKLRLSVEEFNKYNVQIDE